MTDTDSPAPRISRVFRQLDDAQAERRLLDGRVPAALGSGSGSHPCTPPVGAQDHADRVLRWRGRGLFPHRYPGGRKPGRVVWHSAATVRRDPNSPRLKAVVISDRSNIRPVNPLKDIGIGLDDVRGVWMDGGLGLAQFYERRSRSGCYWRCCQQIGEYKDLRVQGFKGQKQPGRNESAKAYQKPPPKGQRFIGSPTRPLAKLEPIAESQ